MTHGPGRRRAALVLTLLLGNAACGAPPAPTPIVAPSVPPATASPSTAPSVGPSPTGETVAHEMPNLGLVVRLPATWAISGSLTGAQLESLRALDPDGAQLFDDGWQAVRVTPGGDLGALDVQPETAMLFVARWVDEDDQDLALDAAMEQVAGRRPRDEELQDVELLGRDALRAFLRESVEGRTRIRLVLVTRLADGRSVAFSITGPAASFDAAAADAVMASIAESGETPLGRPWRKRLDPILRDRLGTLGYDQLLSGDLWTLVRMGGVQGSLLFRTAVDDHPILSAEPDRLRGARTGPSEATGSGFAEVSAIRIDGEDDPGWQVLDPAFTELGYGPGRVGACEGLTANPTTDGHAGALLVAGGAEYLFEAPDMASVIAVAGRVIGC